jgi:hypothetical protein
MKRSLVLICALLTIQFLLPSDALAIPAFARKYGFNCNMCHTAYTKLNDLGQRFRDNGYQIPGQEGAEKNVIDSPLPLALRTSFGYTAYVLDNDTTKGTTSTFDLNGLDLLAAGVLHKDISFLVVYTPRIDEPSSDFSGPDPAGSNASQSGVLESSNLVFSNIVKDALNVRAGRFEPAYHAFSSKRSLYLYQPYEVYRFTTPNNSYVFDDNQMGVEVSGHFKSGFKYAGGIVNGNGANPDNNNQKDLYVNLLQTIGKGDGQTAGQRIGVFGYYGWRPTELPGPVIGSMGETHGKDSKPFYRVGGSGSLNWRTFNLQGFYMFGVDKKKSLIMFDESEDYRYSGGFVQLDYAGLLNNRMVASTVYNWITPPSKDAEREVSACSGLLRYYLGDWTSVNIAAHLEYTYRVTGKTDKFKENLTAIALDFAF